MARRVQQKAQQGPRQLAWQVNKFDSQLMKLALLPHKVAGAEILALYLSHP